MSPSQLLSYRSHRARLPEGPYPARRQAAFGIATALALFLAISGGSLGRFWAFLDFGAGVVALVSLTATVLWGLAATDRAVLGPGHRLIAQAVHRGTAVAGLGFLVLHIWVKVAEGSTGAAAAAVPFTDPVQPLLIGMGTLAGYLFLAVAVTGVARAAFARTERSRWWRALHMSAYAAWGLALVHGLKSGRTASPWVTAAYVLCLAAVAGVLTARLAPKRNIPRRTTPPQPPPAQNRPARPARLAQPAAEIPPHEPRRRDAPRRRLTARTPRTQRTPEGKPQ